MSDILRYQLSYKYDFRGLPRFWNAFATPAR